MKVNMQENFMPGRIISHAIGILDSFSAHLLRDRSGSQAQWIQAQSSLKATEPQNQAQALVRHLCGVVTENSPPLNPRCYVLHLPGVSGFF